MPVMTSRPDCERKHRARRVVAGFAAVSIPMAGLVFALAAPAAAQIPDKFTNLKILPKDIAKKDLVDTMRGFSMALAVRCEFCHIDEEGKQPDFASDAKGPKKTARLMMQMTNDINTKWVAKVESDRKEHQRVSCSTCHHGLNVPRSLQETLALTMSTDGTPAAVQKYRDLHDKYYGKDTYDFSEASLNQMSRSLLEQNKTPDAIALLELNAEFHPQAGSVQYFLGEAELQAGDKDKAKGYFAKAVELDPKNERAKKRLAELGEGQPK